MRILVLSSLVKIDDVRDSVTYNFISRELEALAIRGHEVHCFINRLEKPSDTDSITYLNSARSIKRWGLMFYIFLRYLRYFLIGFFLDKARTYQILKTEASVWQILGEGKFDVLHTHFLWPGGECCVLSAEAHGVPVVATLRGAELRDLPELDYGSMRSGCYRFMFSWAKRKISMFTAPNAELANLLISQHEIPSTRVEVVFNGVGELEGNVERKANVCAKLIAVGWFTSLKNQQLILDALLELPKNSYDLLLVGEGPLEASYRSFIEEHGLYNVQLGSTVLRDQLLKRIGDADLLIHPSLYEGMPNVVLESLAMGTPVAASRISAHESIIIPGYNGHLFDKHSSQELALILKEATGARYKLERMRVNCLKSSLGFSLEKKILNYENVYDRAKRI